MIHEEIEHTIAHAGERAAAPDPAGSTEVATMAEAERRPKQTGARRRPSRPDPAATARRLYADLFSAEERAALASALASDDLEQEVALLRVLIRRAAAEGVSLETLSRAMGRLAQMLRVQHVLRGQAARSLDEALARVLEEIGNELGL